MKSNPLAIKHGEGSYIIQFVRKNLTTLNYVMDLTGPKLKSIYVNLPAIKFDSREMAEITIKNVVIPYLLACKDIDVDEIIGW